MFLQDFVRPLATAGFLVLAAAPGCGEAVSPSELPEKVDRGERLPGKADGVGVPPDWDCSATYYGSGDGCDCGCGAPDPDCQEDAADVCDYDWCQGTLDAEQNWVCDLYVPGSDGDSTDMCEDSGLYGDGTCDELCPAPDPDCSPGVPLDPFDEASCDGSSILVSQLAILNNVRSRTKIGEFQVYERTRQCATHGSCTPWSDRAPLEDENYYGDVELNRDSLSFVLPGCDQAYGIPYHTMIRTSGGTNWFVGSNWYHTRFNQAGECRGGTGYETMEQRALSVTDHCVRIQWERTLNYGAYRIEKQRALVTEF